MNEEMQESIEETVEVVTEKRGIDKRIIAVIAVVAVVAILWIGNLVYHSKSRSMNEAVEALQNGAIEYATEGNGKALLDAFLPGKVQKVLTGEQKQYYLAAADALRQMTNSQAKGMVELKTYSEGFQTALKERIKLEFGDLYQHVKLDSLQVLEMEWQYQGAELSAVLVGYRYQNGWYLLPQIYDDVCEVLVNQDAEMAKAIATALQVSLGNETVYNAFIPYENMVITMNHEFQYLPQVVRDEFLARLGQELPTVAYTRYATDGFAFRVMDGGVEVFVADANNRQEWQLYPSSQTDRTRYLAGENETEQPAIIYENCLMQLICEQSPLLGYWQSEDGGMYIGYSASGGTEGLAVFLQLKNGGFKILHQSGNYDLSWEDGHLIYTEKTHMGGTYTRYAIERQADGTVALHEEFFSSEGDEYQGGNSSNYVAGEVGRDIHAKLEGNWYRAYDHEDVTTDKLITMAYHEACGLVHSQETHETCTYNETPMIVLYDGANVIHYVTPAKNLYVEEQQQICYGGDLYTLDGENQIIDDEYWCGGGGGMYVYFYREGSVEADRALMQGAFSVYLKGQNITYDRCSLVDIDGDNLPELVCQIVDEQFVLKYHNGSVQIARTNWGMALLSYKAGTGEILFSGMNGSYSHHDYYEFDGEAFVYAGGAYITESWDVTGEYNYYVSYEENPDATEPVDKGSYDTFVDSFGKYENTVSCEYTNLYEAFQAYYNAAED